MPEKPNKARICRLLRKALEQYNLSIGGYSDLACMCAISSFSLQQIFSEFSYESTVYLGHFQESFFTHCWLKSDNLYYDLTATQFNVRKKVLIVDESDDRFIGGVPITADSIADWPSSQIPQEKHLEALRRLFYQNLKYQKRALPKGVSV